MARMVPVIVATLASLVLAGAVHSTPQGRLRETGRGWGPCDPGVEQWSGYFDIDNTTDKHYFYWALGPRSRNASAPVLLWMTGGPGCSSSLALLAENGPCHFNANGEMITNPHSWNNDAYVIYIDQPSGTGFSYSHSGGDDRNEAEVSQDMYLFLQALFAAHPSWLKNDFFVVGESYGGHFAPATASRVLKGNLNHEGLHIPLRGLAVGNGLVDPYWQYPSYPTLATWWCKQKLGHQCISNFTADIMRGVLPSCLAAIKGCAGNDPLACIAAKVECNTAMLEPYQFTGLNVYDIRKKCTIKPLCYNFSAANHFMNRKDVQASLGVSPKREWDSCNFMVNMAFTFDWFHPFDVVMPQLLANDVRILVYAGEMDYICNWIGNKNWTLELAWPQQREFVEAKDKPFVVGGEPAALVRSVSGGASPIHFSFMQVFEAGHMVPMDQPATASAMINTFMRNKPFA